MLKSAMQDVSIELGVVPDLVGESVIKTNDFSVLPLPCFSTYLNADIAFWNADTVMHSEFMVYTSTVHVDAAA